jgi:membrane-associated phospholipid phosphatase
VTQAATGSTAPVSTAPIAINVAAGAPIPAGNWTPLVRMQAPSVAVLQDQLDRVNGYADLRGDRAREILAQVTPQYAFWGSVVPIYPVRHGKTLELIGLVLRLAKYAEMSFKNAFAVLRPHELSPQVQPMIQTPAHGSFPSGHSTECFAVARYCELVTETSPLPPNAPQRQQLRAMLLRQAARIAINRTVAGVHYPIDSMAGELLGLGVADYILARFGAAVATGQVDAWQLDASLTATVPNGTGFTGNELLDFAAGARKPPTTYASPVNLGAGAVTCPVAASPNLNWLWNAARAEWK